MRSKLALLTLAAAIAVAFFTLKPSVVDSGVASAATNSLISPNLVISQVQAGGSSNANDEFIELFNRGSSPIDLNGHRLVYRSSTGSNDVGPIAVWTTSTIIEPGRYYLIASVSYDGNVAPDIVFNNSACACSLSATSGGVGLRLGESNTGQLIDSVGWGAATNVFVEGSTAAASGNDNSIARKQNGCQDTDVNSNDFTTLIPSAPRNSSTSANSCDLGADLQASGQASPSQASPGDLVLLTVSVIPATTPPSTSINVSGDLSLLNGSSTQQFFDDGTNGDVTAGDNVFSYLIAVPTGASQGLRVLPTIVTDGQGRSVTPNINLTIVSAPQVTNNLALGNPSGATTDPSNFTNYLMVKSQYVMSYHRDRGIPNWVGWHLDSSWIGSAGRQDDFRPDTTLPAGWYQVTDQDYSGSGFDRGHHCPSGDRTNTVPNNSATFLMTNMMPQAANNNQGPWAQLEVYSRELAAQGNELYIIAGTHGIGGTGSGGGVTNTIANGRVTVPNRTWKIIVVLPSGDNDVDRITKNTRVIAVNMPNSQSIGLSTPWRNFRVNVKQIEQLTGHNFFTNVRPQIRRILKHKLDTL